MPRLNLFIVTYKSEPINYRASILLELNGAFNTKLICLSRAGEKPGKEDIIFIKSRINLFSIFKKLRLRKISNYLTEKFYFPGPIILYSKNVIKYLRQEFKRNSKNALITICPPHDIAFVGFALKKEFPELMWLNDLQDLWTYDEYYFKELTVAKQLKAIQIERQIFNACDYTIVTNDYAEAICKQKYDLHSGKIISIYHPFSTFTIPAGYNVNGLIERIKNKGKIRFAFVGSLFKEPKVPGRILLDELNRFSIIYKWPLELDIIGSSIPDDLICLENKNFKINKYSMMPHQEAFITASDSDFLLLLLGDVPNAMVIMHGKYSHYLALGNLIIAIAPKDSFIQKSINKTGSGFFIDCTGDIAKSISDLFNEIAKGNIPVRNETEIEKFNIDRFKDTWVDIISKL